MSKVKYAVIKVQSAKDPEKSYEHLMSESLAVGLDDIQKAEAWRERYIVNCPDSVEAQNIQVISYRVE